MATSPVMSLVPYATTEEILKEVHSIKEQLGTVDNNRVIDHIQTLKEKVDASAQQKGHTFCGAHTSFSEGKCNGTPAVHHCGKGTKLNASGTLCEADLNEICGTHTQQRAGKCESAQPCGNGTQFDPSSRLCVPSSTVCGSGTRYEASLAKCVQSASPTCGVGTHFDESSNSCVKGSVPPPGSKRPASQDGHICDGTVYNTHKSKCLPFALPGFTMIDNLDKAKKMCDSDVECRGLYQPAVSSHNYQLMYGDMLCETGSEGATMVKECSKPSSSKGAVPKKWPESCPAKPSYEATPPCHMVHLKNSGWGCCLLGKEETCSQYGLNDDSLKRTIDTENSFGGPYSICVPRVQSSAKKPSEAPPKLSSDSKVEVKGTTREGVLELPSRR